MTAPVTNNKNNLLLNSNLNIPIPMPVLSTTLDDINKYYRPELASQILSSIPSNIEVNTLTISLLILILNFWLFLAFEYNAQLLFKI